MTPMQMSSVEYVYLIDKITQFTSLLNRVTTALAGAKISSSVVCTNVVHQAIDNHIIMFCVQSHRSSLTDIHVIFRPERVNRVIYQCDVVG
jgi:hypothetical protein